MKVAFGVRNGMEWSGVVVYYAAALILEKHRE